MSDNSNENFDSIEKRDSPLNNKWLKQHECGRREDALEHGNIL